MKRAPLVAFVLLLIFAVPLAAQSVTVTKPSSGSTCTIGQACLVTWTVSGQPGSKVILELMDKTAPTVVRLIVPEVPIGNLQYTWTIPTDVAAGQYRVQARVYGAAISDIGDVFTIKTSGGSHGELQAGAFHGGVTPIAPLRILEPTSSFVWTVDETHTIRWEAHESVKYPLSLFLVTADNKTPVVDIGKVGSLVSRPTSKSWTVTDNLYDMQYCVRITSADDAVQVLSQPFRIRVTRTFSFDLTNPAVTNKSHLRKVYETSWNDEFTNSGPLPQIADPGGSTVKYGFQRWWEDADNNGYRFHRSLVKFDLAALLAQQKHKWTVKNASISWATAAGSPSPNCVAAVYGLDAAMSDPHHQLFEAAFDAFPKHDVTSDGAGRAQVVQRWIDDPSKNFGIAVRAFNEGQTASNTQCVRFATITMKLQIEEKLNK